MILVKLKKVSWAKRKHWNWFRGLLSDKKDWYVSNQDDADPNKVVTREECIKSILKIRTRKQIRNIVLADYKSMRRLIAKNPQWIYGKTGTLVEKDRDALLKAFGYKSDFIDKETSFWGAYHFYEWAKVDVCPYCNSTEIGVGKDNERGIKVRDQIEHFFPKAQYPFLSITLLNMIPGCSVCNEHKNRVDSYVDRIIYPYRQQFGEKGKFFIDFDFSNLANKKNFQKQMSECIDIKICNKNGDVIDCFEVNNSVTHLKLCAEYNKKGRTSVRNLLSECQSRCKSRVGLLQKFNFPKEDILCQLDKYAFSEGIEYPFRKMKEDVLQQIRVYMENSPLYMI